MNSGPIPFSWELIWLSIGAFCMYLDPNVYMAVSGIMFFGGFFGALAYNAKDDNANSIYQ